MPNMHVERLATEFGVSEQAMTIRLFCFRVSVGSYELRALHSSFLTAWLEVRRSISVDTNHRTISRVELRGSSAYNFAYSGENATPGGRGYLIELKTKEWSGRVDLNHPPPGPKPGFSTY